MNYPKSRPFDIAYADDKECEGLSEEPGGRLHKIHEKEDFDSLVASGKKVLVKFWAPWCYKVRIARFVDNLARGYPGVTMASFDTTEEKLENLAGDMGVKGLPEFRFYKDGKEVLDKIMGDKMQALEEAVQKLNDL